MSNLSSIISLHNKRLLRPRTTDHGCNFRMRETCLLQNHCLRPNQLCRADVENNANKGTKIYFDLAETSFKARFVNYNKDFNHDMNNTRKHRSVKICMIVKRGSNNV